MKKTDRKNKTNQVINWPSNVFTITELNEKNDHFINITLRTRLKKEILDGNISEIGYLHNGKGRPRIVFACSPITQDHIAEAKSRGVILKDELSVNVVNIQNTTTKNSVELIDKIINSAKPLKNEKITN